MASTTICFDFGNTRKKAGIFINGQLEEVVVLREDAFVHIRDLTQKYQPAKTILSSVVDHGEDIIDHLSKTSRFHVLGIGTKLPFTTPVGKPATIGADRLALAAAATWLCPGKNTLVIGLGSCITYNFINKYKELIGGSISPGMEMRFKAMR